MATVFACARALPGRSAAAALLLLVFPSLSDGQEAKLSFRIPPFGVGTPLFSVGLAEPRPRSGFSMPRVMLTNTDAGPRLTSIALLFPTVSLANTPVTPQFGDLHLAQAFQSAPLSDGATRQAIRGMNFSVAGSAPWSVSLGQLSGGSPAPVFSSDGSGVLALSGGFEALPGIAVLPRSIVSIHSGERAQPVVATAIQADLNRHVSLVTDIGATDTAGAGWVPVSAARLTGRWGRTGLETNVLRGAPPLASDRSQTVRSVDRESLGGHVQLVPGMRVSGQASRSRPAASPSAETKAGALVVAYENAEHGQLAAATEVQYSENQQLLTHRIEVRQPMRHSFAVRYTETRSTPRVAPEPRQLSRLVELETPRWTVDDESCRADVQAVIATRAAAHADTRLTSRIKGRLAFSSRYGLSGETEMMLLGSDDRTLRTVRLVSDVALARYTALQVLYAYRTGIRFSVGRSIEVRISRTIRFQRAVESS
jgi:hypothetical protein